MRVLVTGATGELGRPLVARLLAEGCAVRALVRRPDAMLPTAVERAVGDLAAPASLAAAVAGMDVVVHAGAHLGDGGRVRHAQVNAAGTRAILAAAADAGVARAIHVSTVAVHGRRAHEDVLGPWAPCDPEPERRDDYAWSKIAAEGWAACVARETGLPIAVLRPGIIWGGRRRFLARVARRAPGAGLLVLGTPDMRLPMVHVDDVVEAAWRACSAARVPATPLHVVGPDEPTQAAWLAAHGGDASGRVVYLAAGALLARLAAGPVPARARDLAHRLAWATQSVRFDPAPTAAALGWRPAIPATSPRPAPAPAGAAPLALAGDAVGERP
jgi:nucleoside-diphosphate-sugar epimerase